MQILFVLWVSFSFSAFNASAKATPNLKKTSPVPSRTPHPCEEPSLDVKLETYKYGAFGEMYLYSKGDNPKNLILFASGDGGWNQGVIDMAKPLTSEDTWVLGLDSARYAKNASGKGKKCLYFAGDLELVSKFIQAKLGLKDYIRPILFGYSMGAPMVYGAIAQAPENTFAGAVSMGFCADLQTKIPLCKGYGLTYKVQKKPKSFVYEPIQRNLPTWYVLGGKDDKLCPVDHIDQFVESVPKANLVQLEGVSHAYLQSQCWIPHGRNLISKIIAQNETPKPPASLDDLPLIPLPVENSKSDNFVVFLSGDGGWAGFDKDLANEYNKAGIPVVGWNSLKYFWSGKTPEQGALDLTRVIDEFSRSWKKKKVTIVGFSFGADVAPFFVDKLPTAKKEMIDKIVNLAGSEKATFEFHFADWIRDSDEGEDVLPVLQRLPSKIKIQCLYGEDEKDDSICTSLKLPNAENHMMEGGHHFDASADEIYKLIK